MSRNVDVFSTDSVGRRERPFLYPWNRKLRHLQGISLRNLDVTSTTPRSRGKTITDENVPYHSDSPAKRLVQKESNTLQHSRSFSDLTSPARKSSKPLHNVSASFDIAEHSKGRPGLGKMRRRSTLHWTGASPRARQQKLEDVAASRMVDTWFSIHSESRKDPIYVSEVMERSMNPSFRFFDLVNSGPGVSRLDQCTLKVWAKTQKMDEYSVLIDLDLNLRSLQFIGRTLENFHHPLPQNCVLFHLSDGVYTSFTDLPVDDHGHPFLSGAVKSTNVENTSSYDALMKLANLDDCVQDALNTRRALETQINVLLVNINDARNLTSNVTQVRHELTATNQGMAAENKQVRQLTKRRDEILRSLAARRAKIANEKQMRSAGSQYIDMVGQRSEALRSETLKCLELSAGQIRRIGEDLLVIFPIEPVRNKTLQFSIRSIHLPNSAFDDTNRDEIAAAVGMVSRLVNSLSMYMSVPLPYPIGLTEGDPFISDPISMALAQRRFPLRPTNVAYKFEYGVFLLNKDIEFLMSKAGLRMLDIRHTLPNLKYLLYVLTAGSGELPARKAGGVRGLSGGRLTPSLSRRGSDESVFSNHGYSSKLAAEAKGRNGGIPIPGNTREKSGGDLHDPFIASPRTKTLPYRNSLLRETG